MQRIHFSPDLAARHARWVTFFTLPAVLWVGLMIAALGALNLPGDVLSDNCILVGFIAASMVPGIGVSTLACLAVRCGNQPRTDATARMLRLWQRTLIVGWVVLLGIPCAAFLTARQAASAVAQSLAPTIASIEAYEREHGAPPVEIPGLEAWFNRTWPELAQTEWPIYERYAGPDRWRLVVGHSEMHLFYYPKRHILGRTNGWQWHPGCCGGHELDPPCPDDYYPNFAGTKWDDCPGWAVRFRRLSR